MKRLLIAAACAALFPLAAQAQTVGNFARAEGTQEITLSGTGSSSNDFDNGSLGISGSYGYYFSPAFEGGIRQSLNWSGARNSDDSVNASTRLFADYHFNTTGRFQPFIGANVGMIYGDGVNETGIVSPEIGIKYYVNPTTFILAMAEYQIFFESSDDIEDNFEDSALAYTIGMGFTF